MSKGSFSAKEQEQLRKNPYTFRVTAKQISFTSEFKEEFWKMYSEKGLCPAAIVELLGYDSVLLGSSRISGIQRHIKNEMQSPAGPHNGRRGRRRSKLSASDGYAAPGSLEEMRHEIQYLRQEVEYLKKISSIKATKK